MRALWWVFASLLVLPSCLVPLGYTTSMAQGWVSDSESARYLQLSIEYLKKGQEVQQASKGDQVALAQGLEPLTAEFKTKIDQLTGGATEGDEIPTGDDTAVPRRSMAGVALTEALSPKSAGRSLDAEFSKVVQAETGARGLYLSGQSIWPLGTVNYRWASASSPDAEDRQAILSAMDTWHQASGGLVNFHELGNDPWVDFQLTIGVVGCIIISEEDLGPGITGRATVGYQCGSIFGYLKLSPQLTSTEGLRRTALHELGHVLGILHEHKRADRDQWIDVASGGYSLSEADMGKIDEYVSNLRWKPSQVNMGAWSVTLYFPVWWQEKQTELVGPFDLRSVMLYSGFLTRKDWPDPVTGTTWPVGSVVPWNTTLSTGDVATVKSLYSR